MINNVSRYYDLNTSRFLRFGHGRSSGAIHRAVWAEGVNNRREAIDYVNTVISGFIEEADAGNVLDIGCGIGGSMVSIAGNSGADVTGVTISRVQAETGSRYLESRGASGNCRIYEGDFNDPEIIRKLKEFRDPDNSGRIYDMLFAVESFLHMEDAGLFFSHAADLLSPGGELIICDDFLLPARGEGEKISRLLKEFKKGWQVKTLLTADDAAEAAGQCGFSLISQRDLTPFLELNRPRDILIRAVVPAAKLLGLSSPFWLNLTGGDALQRLFNRGALAYRLLRFKKLPSAI